MNPPRITTRAEWDAQHGTGALDPGPEGRVVIHTCRDCKRALPESAFYSSSGRRCKQCARRANRARKAPCTDCGALKWPGSERCRACEAKRRRTLSRRCSDCATEVTPGAVRCLACHNKNQDKGRSSERVKFNGSPEWAAARAECFARDAYTCQDCGARNAEGFGRTVVLHAHHVLPWSEFPKQRLDTATLVTLCADCHKAFHSSLAAA